MFWHVLHFVRSCFCCSRVRFRDIVILQCFRQPLLFSARELQRLDQQKCSRADVSSHQVPTCPCCSVPRSHGESHGGQVWVARMTGSCSSSSLCQTSFGQLLTGHVPYPCHPRSPPCLFSFAVCDFAPALPTDTLTCAVRVPHETCI